MRQGTQEDGEIRRECDGRLVHELDAFPIKHDRVLSVRTKQEKIHEASWSSGRPSGGNRGARDAPNETCSSERNG
jgi:hypothetical protein